MAIVKAQCRQCGVILFIPEFQCGGAGCPACLAKNGNTFAKTPNRGLLKRKRLGKNKALKLAVID